MLPLRAVATVTGGFCAAGHHHEETVAAHEDHGGMGAPTEPSTPGCSTCAEHCCSAAFAPSLQRPLELLATIQDRVAFAECSSPAFFPDHLDRPPLA